MILKKLEDNLSESRETYKEAFKKDAAYVTDSVWSNSQADFLKESIAEDSDWAVVVDHLNVLLRD
ncbi:DUF2789 family protein [uncultured Cocleimonas sp.]|uniref:DUF2789 family protein n=1 Tax=uncultured Cocleimonas sp. TaxID=1051587 RepID=UPI0026035407|nr:DUF2789 family protein [uncultured Cocleimonas sp.]